MCVAGHAGNGEGSEISVTMLLNVRGNSGGVWSLIAKAAVDSCVPVPARLPRRILGAREMMLVLQRSEQLVSYRNAERKTWRGRKLVTRCAYTPINYAHLLL
jgi:hypothetical protein